MRTFLFRGRKKFFMRTLLADKSRNLHVFSNSFVRKKKLRLEVTIKELPLKIPLNPCSSYEILCHQQCFNSLMQFFYSQNFSLFLNSTNALHFLSLHSITICTLKHHSFVYLFFVLEWQSNFYTHFFAWWDLEKEFKLSEFSTQQLLFSTCEFSSVFLRT